MKHIWVVESSGGKKYRPAGNLVVRAYFSERIARTRVKEMALESPGLKWRVAKYERVK